MSMKGNWMLQYCWSPSPTPKYSQASILFNDDRTFTVGTEKGNWRLTDGTLMLNFLNGPAVYGGNVDGNAGVGAMATFNGMEGNWILAKGTTALVAESAKQACDPSGNRL